MKTGSGGGLPPDYCADWPQFGSVADALDALATQGRDGPLGVYTCRCCGRYHLGRLLQEHAPTGTRTACGGPGDPW